MGRRDTREHFTATGKPKKAYKDKRAADIQADRQRRDYHEDYDSYRCSLCKDWHTGRYDEGA